MKSFDDRLGGHMPVVLMVAYFLACWPVSVWAGWSYAATAGVLFWLVASVLLGILWAGGLLLLGVVGSLERAVSRISGRP